MNKNRAKEYVKEALSLRLSLQNTKGLKSYEKYEGHLKDFPKSLFKYRCFNKFTIDSISNNYLYLSPAKELDDQFECTANFDPSITYSNEIIEKYFVEEVANMISDYPSNFKKSEMKKLMYECLDKKSKISAKKEKIDLKSSKIKSNCSSKESKEILKIFGALISGMWMNDKTPDIFNDLIKKALSAKDKLGIGSLSEINTSQVMWDMYSDHYSGYCVEYDTSDDIDLKINTFPVVYGNKRQTNILSILIGMIVEGYIVNLSNNKEYTLERSLDYFYLIITKYKEWEFQKEWRIVGDAYFKFPMPKIKSIYLGKKCTCDNEKLIIKLAKELGFSVYKQKDNYVDLSIDFEKIYN